MSADPWKPRKPRPWRRGYADAYGGPGVCPETDPTDAALWREGREAGFAEQRKQPRQISQES